MKLLAWMPTAYFLFLLLFLRFLPSKAGAVGRNTTQNAETIAFDGTSGHNMASASDSISVNLENPSFTGWNGYHEGPCGQIPEQEPPKLVVIHKKETGDGKGLQEEVNFQFEKDGETTEVGDEGVMSIMCSANYPIYLVFRLNDGYFTYFFKPDGKYCKCEPEACNHCFKLGITFPMKVWNSLKETRLTFTCRSISGRALMQKKAVLTRGENSTHNVAILTTSTDKLETTMMPQTSNGGASVRIGNCQLDSHGDNGFFTEVSEKIPACNDKLNKENDPKPCLTEVNLAQLTGTKDNSFVNTNLLPFLDMDVLERMICNFDGTSLHDENTEETDYNCDYPWMTGQSENISERTSKCWRKCLWNALFVTFLLAAVLCWFICIQPWCRRRALRRNIDTCRRLRETYNLQQRRIAKMAVAEANVSNLFDSIIAQGRKGEELIPY